MKLFQLDQHPDYSMGVGPLALCVQTLDTLTRSPAVTWDPSQRAAACKVVADARKLLEADVLTLAGQVHPRPGVTLGDGFEPPKFDKYAEPPMPPGHGERLDAALQLARAGDGYNWRPIK